MTVASIPSAADGRVESIDVLRGVAVLGILFMNIQTFAMPMEAYGDPSAYGSMEGINRRVWQWTHLLADTKFMSIFSMLFGAGLVLFVERLNRSGRPGIRLHLRRMAWLLVIGVVHAYGIWFGDILVGYALCGMAVIWLRRIRPWLQLTLGVMLVSVASLLLAGFGTVLLTKSPEMAMQAISGGVPREVSIAWQVESYRGGWSSQLEHRASVAAAMQFLYFPIWMFWRAGGMMLIGMALFRWGIFSATRSIMFYSGMLVLGAGLGVPLIWWGMTLNEAAGWDQIQRKFFHAQLNYWGSIPMALAWVAAVMLFVRSGGARWLHRSLSAVGRMALTNYLLQSVLCSLIFYGSGLGFYGEVSRLGQLTIAVGLCLLQLLWSVCWLSAFRFGPLEWFWRNLTYWRIQPIRRPAR